MNKKGSISVFLIIIASTIITSFLILFQLYSFTLVKTDIQRSLNLVSKNILASYEDHIYDNYGLLAYEQVDQKAIEKDIYNTFNNFSSPVNMYRLKKVTVDYQVKGINNYDLLLNQIVFFTKNKISLSLARDIFTNIGKSNLYIKKTKEIQSKLKGNKGYDELKKIHKKIKSAGDSLAVFEANASSYLKVITIYEQGIQELKSIEITEEVKDLKSGIEGMQAAYEKSYNDVKLEYSEVKAIIALEKKIKRLKKRKNRIQLNENLSDQEKVNQINTIRRRITSTKRTKNKHMDRLNTFISDHHQGLSMKDRLSQLENSVKKAKDVLGYGDISSYDNKAKTTFVVSMDKSILLNEYILGTFKTVSASHVRDYDFYQKINRDSVSNAEVEYIIKGHKDSATNVTAVGKDIFLMREALNLAHLMIDNEKREFIFNTAKTPAIGVFAAAGMTAIWTTAESLIDMFKLYGGNGTPFLKITDESFVLDLETILHGAAIDYNVINKQQMMYYHDYLRLFLYNKSDELKIQRLLDVIHTDYPVDTLVLEHDLMVECIFINKLTGSEKRIMTKITGEYIYE